jgi:sugar/nucleoside kinase (ribokinase family)
MPPLEAFGLPVTWYESSRTTEYSFHYEGERRVMRQDAVGDPWPAVRAAEAAADARWVNVCALTRSDFPPETLAALAENGRRRLLVDVQGLVRTPTVGPLHMDADIGDVLRHIDVLKLNEVEAETLVGVADPERLRALAVPEVILTLGSQGAWVVTPEQLERVPAVPVDGEVDPTGAGDTYAATYIVQRAAGADPVEAARAAAESVAIFLASP